MITVEYYGEPNLERLFEALAQAAAEQMGGCAKVASIRRKDSHPPEGTGANT